MFLEVKFSIYLNRRVFVMPSEIISLKHSKAFKNEYGAFKYSNTRKTDTLLFISDQKSLNQVASV